jgi:CelD/BcsL family acetyltransferase involved in cellulose biosynthesis
MNLFSSPEFLGAIADTYHKGRRATIEDVRVAGEVLRLLVLDNQDVITRTRFLDYHVPLAGEQLPDTARKAASAPYVVRGVVDQAEWERGLHSEFVPAPYVDWSLFPTFDDYRKFIKQRKRDSVRKLERLRRRMTEKFGGLQFSANDARSDALELAARWKGQQLRASGERDFFADPRTIEFFELLRQRGILTASTLRTADGQLLSVWLGAMHDKVWSGWIFTYDQTPEIAYFSPGHQLVQSMLEESHRLGHREFDFSIGSSDYKWTYATHVRVLGWLGQPPLVRLMLERARRQAKKYVSRSPRLRRVARSVKRIVQGYGIPA